MGLTPACSPPVDADNTWLAPEIQALATLREFSVRLVSNICWAHLMFAYSLPRTAAVLLTESRAARQAGMDRLQTLIEAALRADSLACGNQALPQEVMAACVQSDFDCDFMPLRQLMMKCHSGSNTTREVCFATLQDKVSRQSKNKKACGTTLWFYSLTSKYARGAVSGMRHLPLGQEQWAAAGGLYGDGKSKEFQNYANAFALNSTKLPQGAFSENPEGAAKDNTAEQRTAKSLPQLRSSCVHDARQPQRIQERWQRVGRTGVCEICRWLYLRALINLNPLFSAAVSGPITAKFAET